MELGGGKDIIDKENSFIVISKIAVPLKQDAFRTIRLRFSPQFKEKDPFIQKIHELLPESEVEVI